jgi:aromatic ring hydroxylase
MRTGAEYREGLRDGRKVWIMGEGRVDDMTTHPSTRAMVDEYAAWFDRHINPDPEWRDILLSADGKPWAFHLPRTVDDLRAMGRCFSSLLFLSAGNITHTPIYGNLIALGITHASQQLNAPQKQIDNALAYRQLIADTGRFLTFSAGGATIGYRYREDPADRAALRIVKETDAGVVIKGKVGMHTTPAFADDVYIGGWSGADHGEQRASFIVSVNAPGVTVVCRKPAVHHANPFIAPLSSRYDELDGQMWLDDVFIPWERVFMVPTPGMPHEGRMDTIALWLYWHQLYAWLAKAEFTLGVALACTEVMGLRDNPPTIEYLVDLMEVVQTVRTCETAAELDPEMTPAGYCMPNQAHIAAGGLALLKGRQRMSEIIRILPGSSLVVAPADTDLASPEMAAGLEESFGGGGYTALQRGALLNMAWDHVSSGLDGRESAFELNASGGIPAWRQRLRREFDRNTELANAVLQQLSVEIPHIDLSSLRNFRPEPRRAVTPAAPAEESKPAPAP